MANKKNRKEQKETFGFGIGNVTSGVTGGIGSILTSPLSLISDSLGLGNIGDYIKYIIIVFAVIIAIYILFKLKGSSNNYPQYPQYPPRY